MLDRPYTERTGLKTGLFGGSFNPAHNGHRLVAETALNQLGLDQVFWMVSPGNPLKNQTYNYDERAASISRLGLSRSHIVTHFERDHGTRYTIDMLQLLLSRYPEHRFVWLMGADNLRQMPKWKDWQEIMHLLPIAVIGRPGQALRARTGQVARQFSEARLPEHQATVLPNLAAPAWTYLTPPLSLLSSTQIRQKRKAAVR